MGPSGLLLGILALYGAMDISGRVRGNHVLASSKENSLSKDDSTNDRSAPFVVINGEDNNSNDDSTNDRSAPFVVPNGEDNNSKDPLPTKTASSNGVTVNIPVLNDKDDSVNDRSAPFVVINGEDNNSNDSLPKKLVFNNGFTMKIPVLNDEPEYHRIKQGIDISKAYVVDRPTDFLERNPAVLPDGTSLTEGDMVLTKEQLEHFYNHAEDRKAINSDFYSIPGFLDWNARWPEDSNGTVIIKYLITNSSAEDEAIIKQALQHWMNRTCLQFQQVTTGGTFSHVFFSKIDSGCFSNVGRIPSSIGGPTGQKVSIGNGCETLGTIVHEVGHAIGFFHEQSRADRQNYVNVFLDNVLPGRENNFNKELKSNSHGVPYDYTSIMHYGDKFFTKNGKATLSPKDPTLVGLIGQRAGLSFRDTKLANIIYNCTQKLEKMCNITVNPCQNEGYIGKNCMCVCRPGTQGQNCEQVTRPYYPPLPCGGVVTTTNPITSPFFPGSHSSTLNCVWLIRAPACQIPQITITAFQTYFRSTSGVCNIEGLEIRTDNLFNGTTFCGTGTTYNPNNQDLTAGQTFMGTGRELVLNFFSRFININTGFSATVQFINSTNCTSNTTMPPTTMPPTTMPPTTMPPTTMPPTTMPPTTMPPTTIPPTTMPPDPCTLPLNVTATGSCSLRRHGTKWVWSRSWFYGAFTCTLSVRTQGCPKKLKIHIFYFPSRRWSSFCLNHTPLLPWKQSNRICSSNPICQLARGKQICVPTSNFNVQVTSRWLSTRPFVIQVVELPSTCHKRIVLSTTSPTAMISSADSRGGKNCEWFIEAPPGRKINVTFKSWTLSKACSRALVNTGWYGMYWGSYWMRICRMHSLKCQSKSGGLLISPTGDVFYSNIQPLCTQITPTSIISTSNELTISYQRIARHRRNLKRRPWGKRPWGKRPWGKRPWGQRPWKRRSWRRGPWRRRPWGVRPWKRGSWRRSWQGRGWGNRRKCGRWLYGRTFPHFFEAMIMLI